MSTKTARTKSITVTSEPALRRLAKYRGIIRRVARRKGWDHSHVSRVARGLRQSKPVTDALLAEIQRIEGRAA